jgi:hypothetical protein
MPNDRIQRSAQRVPYCSTSAARAPANAGLWASPIDDDVPYEEIEAHHGCVETWPNYACTEPRTQVFKFVVVFACAAR